MKKRGEARERKHVRDSMPFPPVSFDTQIAFVLNTVRSVSKCGSTSERGNIGKTKSDPQSSVREKYQTSNFVCSILRVSEIRLHRLQMYITLCNNRLHSWEQQITCHF